MAQADKITITGKIGPGNTLTSKVITNVNSLHFDFNKQVLSIDYNSTDHLDVDLYTIATVTYSIATRVATVVVST